MGLSQSQDDLSDSIEGLRVSPSLLPEVSQHCGVVGVESHGTTLLSWDGLQAYAFPPVAILPRVLAYLLASTGTELTLVAPPWAQRPWFSDLLQLSLAPPAFLRPVKATCACLGLVVFPRISVDSGFMPGDSPAISQSRWLLHRSSGAVFTGAPSILARSISGAMDHLS